MITFTEAQIVSWLSPLLWPFIRAMALFQAMPVMGTRAVPMRVRIGLSVFIAIASQGSLPPLAPEIATMPLSAPPMLLLIAQQIVIGLSLGFAVRIVFAAVEFAGEIIGLQMGLNFAGFFDPLSASMATASFCPAYFLATSA